MPKTKHIGDEERLGLYLRCLGKLAAVYHRDTDAFPSLKPAYDRCINEEGYLWRHGVRLDCGADVMRKPFIGALVGWHDALIGGWGRIRARAAAKDVEMAKWLRKENRR